MNLYDFAKMSIVEAFRHLTTHLHLTGESQVLDRIIHDFAKRYWACNTQYQYLYISEGMLYHF